MTPQQLAQASNGAIYASMITLAIAMVFFAASFAVGRRRAVPVTAAVVTESAGGTAVLTRTDPPNAGDPGRRSANIGMSLTWLGMIFLAAGVALRGVWAGRVPWGDMYEFSITAALGILVVFLLVSLRQDIRWLGLFIVIPVLLTLGIAVTVLYTESAQLVPALKSYWLLIHVTAAIISSGAFTLAAAVSAVALFRGRAERKADGGPVTGLAARFPDQLRLQTMANRIIAFTFPLWTFAIIAGAIWAENAWGRYWGWDPKETWAFITWVIFACYLHARSTVGWRGNRASWIAIIGFSAFLVNYFVINVFAASLHSYSGL